MKVKISLLLSTVALFFVINAKTEGTMISGDPYESWNNNTQDFFVMFNSNIDDKIVLFDEKTDNPQGDTCIEESFFTLNNFHIPDNAVVEKAYLIWMGAVDPAKLSNPTDNSVKLKFIQEAETEPVIYEKTVTAGTAGKLLTDPNGFDFESMYYQDSVINGCSETESGTFVSNQHLGYFTYRMDVTSFFDKIAEMNAENEKPENGKYYGTYSFSDLDCTEHDNYRCKTTMVSSWAVIMIYRSLNVSQKSIYLYNGFSFVQGDRSEINVSGFELPENPVIRLTSMIAEGDPKLVDPQISYAEGIHLQGKGAASKFRINNECNPIMGSYVEVFNSVSSVINWDPDAIEKLECVSAVNKNWINYGIDVDTFLLDREENFNIQEQLKEGDTEFNIFISVNQDAIFTNFLILSVDSKDNEVYDDENDNDQYEENDETYADFDNADDEKDDVGNDENPVDIDSEGEKTDNTGSNDENEDFSLFSDEDVLGSNSGNSSGCSCILM